MSFDEFFEPPKEEKKKVTDPKLLRFIQKSDIATVKAKPDLTKVRDEVHAPSPTVSLIMNGVPKKLESEVYAVFRCNKCELEFNHTPAQVVSGMMPACPKCDR